MLDIRLADPHGVDCADNRGGSALPMSKIDFKKELKDLYLPSSKLFQAIDVPAMNFLMIDGHGDPNTAKEYKDALETLYPVAYHLKFLSKQRGRDYVVPPLEGLWWADDMTAFSAKAKDQWDWTMMLMVPEGGWREWSNRR